MTITTTASFTAVDILDLKALGEALFAEWYPTHCNGDPVPTMPPPHLMHEARELALQHRMAAARQRGARAA